MPITRYGIDWPEQFNDLMIELKCFSSGLRKRVIPDSPGTYRHFVNIRKILWPKFITHDWHTDRVKNLCEYAVNSWVGCAASGKTFDAGLWAMTFFIADPENTSVVLTSTTSKMVRKRIWPVIQELYHACDGFPGNLVDSKTTLQARKGDDKHGIFAVAVREGSTAKAVADIQGVHAPRMLLIVDEATDTPEAIFEAISNLRKGCVDFRLIVIGNPVSQLDPHGIIAEPKDGWRSVSVESEEWETNGVSKWEIDPGICMHFDGLKSPNVKAGERKWPFLISQQDVDRSKGEHNGEESLGFWKYTRGFWAPEGVCKTVLSEAMVEKHGARGRLIFLSKAIKIAALDPAFGGGDRAVLRTGSLGDLEGDKLGIQLEKTFELIIRPRSKEPVHYQLAYQVKEICEKEGIEPRHFIMDSTGEGGGLASIIAVEWASGFEQCEFGGSPSDLPVSQEDPKPAKEAYDRKVTELWFSVRRFVIGGQIGGLTVTDCKELCGREFSDEKRKIVLDTKADCKAKIGRSPDYGDSVVLMVELGRRLGAAAGGASERRTNQNWLAKARELDEVYTQADKDESDMSLFSPAALEEAY